MVIQFHNYFSTVSSFLTKWEQSIYYFLNSDTYLLSRMAARNLSLDRFPFQSKYKYLACIVLLIFIISASIPSEKRLEMMIRHHKNREKRVCKRGLRLLPSYDDWYWYLCDLLLLARGWSPEEVERTSQLDYSNGAPPPPIWPSKIFPPPDTRLRYPLLPTPAGSPATLAPPSTSYFSYEIWRDGVWVPVVASSDEEGG